MAKTTWRNVLRDDPSDLSPLTKEEGMLMMRVAFLLAADYPAAVAGAQRDGFQGQADLYATMKSVTP